MNTVFIYVLRCPANGDVRYVGKSVNPTNRLSHHLADKVRCHRTNWISSLKVRMLKPILEVIDEVPDVEWESWEVAYIQFFKEEGCNLVNQTVGGEAGPSWQGKKHKESTRIKQSAAAKGKPKSLAQCEAMRKANLGKKRSPDHCKAIAASLMGNQWNVGKKRSAESCAKQSATCTGRIRSPEAVAKTAAANRGRERSAVGCANMAAAQQQYHARRRAQGISISGVNSPHFGRPAHNKGVPASAEQKENQRATMTGRTLTEAHRAAISAGGKGRKQSPEHIARRAAAVKAFNAAKRAAKLAAQSLPPSSPDNPS